MIMIIEEAIRSEKSKTHFFQIYVKLWNNIKSCAKINFNHFTLKEAIVYRREKGATHATR